MGGIASGIGLISGIDTANLIEQLILIESTPKFRLEERVATLQAQQTAMLDINARLLNLKNAAHGFFLNKTFHKAAVTSSNEEVITATTGDNAVPGTYSFTVKQLVSTSQQMTHGFANTDSSPLGLDAISFEFGKGRLASNALLEELNGGDGVSRGNIVITDRAGDTGTIDLTDVVSLDEVVDRINQSLDIKVTATLEGDHLTITDTSGGTSNLIIVSEGNGTTAADLGIDTTDVGIAGNVTGTDINTLGSNTALSALNDGNGVLIRDNVTDFEVTVNAGTAVAIDLGRIDVPIDDDTALDDLNNGAGITINDDEEEPDIVFTARDGTEHEVNLTGVTTVGQLRTRIDNETGGDIQLTVDPTGTFFTVTDTTGGTGNLKVDGAGPNLDEAAEDLGILNEAGVAANSFDGTIVLNADHDPRVATLGELADRVTTQLSDAGETVALRINAAGTALEFYDTLGGTPTIQIDAGAIDGNLANVAAKTLTDLGFTDGQSSGTGVLTAGRAFATLGSVLVDSLNGGTGLNGATTLNITDRAGNTLTVNNANAFDSLSELIDEIHTAAGTFGANIAVSLNDAGTGLLITDTVGGAGNLIISGDAASELGIETAGVAADEFEGSNLQLKYVDLGQDLSQLNYGQGVGTGRFEITDGLGNSATVNIGSDSQTLYDIVNEINSRGLAIVAKINSTGDGLLIEEDTAALGGTEPFVPIKIESLSGSTASDLNIIGEASDVQGGPSVAKIDGSYEQIVDLSVTDNLNDVVAAINDAGVPVTASVINTGIGAKPFRINFSSEISGANGEMIIDTGGVDIGLSVITTGEDAKVFFGSEDPSTAFLLTSSDNILDGVVQGVTIDLLDTSDEAVTLTVKRDIEGIKADVTAFVAGFNDAVGRIDEYDFFDVETERRGVLLGESVTSNTRNLLIRTVQRQAENLDGPYQFLRDVGITIGANSELQFNTEKFDEALETDFDAVAELFAAFEATAGGSTEISPGITIPDSNQNITKRGLGEIFDEILEGLTNSTDGTFTLADNRIDDQIELAQDRISTIDDRLASRRLQLQSEFAAMESALARLQGQSNALVSLSSNRVSSGFPI